MIYTYKKFRVWQNAIELIRLRAFVLCIFTVEVCFFPEFSALISLPFPFPFLLHSRLLPFFLLTVDVAIVAMLPVLQGDSETLFLSLCFFAIVHFLPRDAS